MCDVSSNIIFPYEGDTVYHVFLIESEDFGYRDRVVTEITRNQVDVMRLVAKNVPWRYEFYEGLDGTFSAICNETEYFFPGNLPPGLHGVTQARV